MLTYYAISQLQQVSEFDLFTLDDIDSAFQNVTRLTYSQNYHLSGKIFANNDLNFYIIYFGTIVILRSMLILW